MKSFLLIVTALSLASYALALSCFMCNSVEDGTCQDEELVECNILSATAGTALLLALKPSVPVLPSSSFQCYKLVAEQNANNNRVTIKGCTYETTPVCDGKPLNAEQIDCYTCTENACNGATSRLGRTSFGVAMALLLAVWAGFYKR